MKISDRIKAICGAVTSGETVADIGTDHAYVPLILYKNNISPQEYYTEENYIYLYNKHLN